MHILAGIELRSGFDWREAGRQATEAGATWADVHDAEAAAGRRNQWLELSRLLGESGLRIQFGGGVRSMTQVQQLIELGVERVAVGTQAIENPLWLRELCILFPGRMVLRLELEGEAVLLHGRTQEHNANAAETVRTLARHGPVAILAHDPAGVSPALAAKLAAAAGPVAVQVSLPGGEPAALAQLAATSLEAAVVPVADPALEAAVAQYPAPRRSPIVRVLAAKEAFAGAGTEDEEDLDEGEV